MEEGKRHGGCGDGNDRTQVTLQCPGGFTCPCDLVKNFVSINRILAHFVVVAMCDKVMGWMTDDLVTAAWCATEECQQRPTTMTRTTTMTTTK